jgi:hypothetical protein
MLGAAVESLPGGFAVVLPAPDAPLAPETEARYQQRFSRAIYVYAPRQTGAARGLFRVATVHHEPDGRARAGRYGRLAARLLRLHREHFGQDAAFGRDEPSADVWLSPGPAPVGKGVGGETHGSQVYVWATATAERTPLEWTRTLAHEWGHLTLPAARGFTEPEGDASGYLGERLYMKWLREDSATARPPRVDDGTVPADLDVYHRRQIAPLMGRWQQGGPQSRLLDARDTAAMDYYIGAALAADDAFGSRVLGRALFTVLDARPRDFLHSIARVTAEMPSVTVRLPAWTPLAKGTYAIAAETPGVVALGGDKVAVSRGRPGVVRVPVWGWERIRSVRGNVSRIILRREAAPGGEDRSL